jgi:hypothetical protein
MGVTVGQLAVMAAKEIVKWLSKGPDSNISASEIVALTRQNFIGKSTNIIIAPGRAAGSDSDEAMLLVAHRCMDLLAGLDGMEVTFNFTADGRSISIRRKSGDVREQGLLRALDETGSGTVSGPSSPVTAPIAASSLARGHLEVFVLPADGVLRRRWHWPDPGWCEWGDLSLPAGRPTAIAAGSKDEYAQEIAVAVGDTVCNRWWTGEGSGWSGWDVMPRLGAPVVDLAFSSKIADELEIYALDGRGRIHHRWWWRDQGWSEGWTPMDAPAGRPVTAIAAGSYADYHQELFAIVDGEVWHRWLWRNDGWSAWRPQAPVGMRATDIAVSSLKEGHIEVFAISDGGRPRHRWHWAGRGWSDWEDFPVPIGSRLTAIAAASKSLRHQEIYGLTGSGNVVHTWNWLHDDGKPDWQSWSEWSDWQPMPRLT